MNEIAGFNPNGVEEANTDPIPHSIEAEQQLLGAILTNNDIFDKVAEVITADHFYDPVHQRIYEIARARITANALASPVTLKAYMKDDAGLQELGGPSYLVKLAGSAISSFAARDYAQIIYDFAVRRELIKVGKNITDRASKVEVGAEAGTLLPY